jgi:lipoprotein NlpD
VFSTRNVALTKNKKAAAPFREKALFGCAALKCSGVLFCIFLFSCLCLACAYQPYVKSRVHIVRQDETLMQIARQYKVSVDNIAKANNIDNRNVIFTGQELYIPADGRLNQVEKSGSKSSEIKAVSEKETSGGTGGSSDKIRSDPGRIDNGRAGIPDKARGPWIWPLSEGRIVSEFGNHGGLHQDGILIETEFRAPVYSIGDGVVSYCGGGIRGYGNIIIIDHGDGLTSVYARNDDNLVSLGDGVGKGEMIARVGRMERLSNPTLYFELRRHAIPKDPLRFLPKR